MKKRNKDRSRHLALELERRSRNLRRKRLKEQRRQLASGHIPQGYKRAVVLAAPPVFALGENSDRSKLLVFLRRLREFTVLKRVRVVIDFHSTTRMVSAGTLLFLAEVQRIATVGRQRRRKLIGCKRIVDKTVAQVLHQVGFFDAIGRKSDITPTASDVIHWRAISGSGAEGYKAHELIERLKDHLPASLSSPMYAGLVEAMTNSRQHAYVQKRRDGLGLEGNGEWWLFAQERDGRLYVAICDLGIGIPNSLPLTQDQSAIVEIFARLGRTLGAAFSDAHLVHAAVEVGRSRTRDRHRGKGLNDVIDVIKSARSGDLRIHSNRGCYIFTMKNGNATNERRNYKHSILGTVIQWSVPVGDLK